MTTQAPTADRSAPAYRIDGVLATREAFYATACDPRRSAVVEACAGAGKTWMLVSRILRALLDGAQPQEILAITFTRKAAGEMRTRLSEWLREFAAADAPTRVRALLDRGLSGAEAAARADDLARLHLQVLDSGRAVEVRTFHAWFSQLLRAAPLDLLGALSLQPDMALVEDLEDLKPELFRRFHARVLVDAALSADYHALVAHHGRSTLRKWLEAAWDKRVEIELADEAGTLEGAMPAPAPGSQEFMPAFKAQAAEVAAAFGRMPGVKTAEAAQALEAALAEPDPDRRLRALQAALFTKGGSPRKLPAVDGCNALIDELQRLDDARAQQEAHDEHRRMVALSRALLEEYAALKQRRALVDMADLERVALALLADSTLSGWVQERLDARVRHLLIDEFQDTSPLQWHALHAWLSGYAGAGGGRGAPSVFIVGDPKQSIYRFRRAEPRVFEAARLFVTEGLQGAVLECDHTRRNAGAVIAAVNAVFGELAAEGAYPGWRPHTTEVGDTVAGEVRTLPGIERPPRAKAEAAERVWRDSLSTPRVEAEAVLREAEAAQVAVAIAALVREQGFSPGDIQVLSRKRASLRLVAAALQALHLPCAAPEDASLAERPEVRDLVALLDVLASPGHDLSLAHALKSPLFGASDEDLLQLADAVRAPGGWWAALLGGVGSSAALRRARELLGRWSEAARRLPPHDLLDRVLHEGDLVARLAAAVPPERRGQALQAVDALIAQSLALDGGRYATPYNFVRALRQRVLKHAMTGSGDAVQLLTIHGAKGLEARAVFVMDAEPEPQQAEHAALLVEWPVEAARPRRVAFVSSESRCPPQLRDALEQERQAREREEHNGLYVAMTRARERLVFSRTPPFRKADGRSWWQRIETLATPWEPPAAFGPTGNGQTGAAEQGGAACALVPALPSLGRAERPLPAPAGAAVDDEAARLGQAVHRVLEWSTGPAGKPARVERSQLAASACAAFDLPIERAAEVDRIAGQVLDSAACAPFFDHSRLHWAANEVPVADAGEALRIDRLVALPGSHGPVWWVLDYKLNHAPAEVDAYREQLARYRRAVQALQPGAEVRAAFITGEGRVVTDM